MQKSLRIAYGQYSDKGRKAQNQDFHGLHIPKEPLLSSKGIALALADGISSSSVSHVAAQSAVTGFLEDYFCTSEAWSVRTSVERVLGATNAWLFAQTQQSPHRFDMDRGYVCAFAGLVLKSTTVHIFHAGDSRIYRARGSSLDLLTQDHRLKVSSDTSYLARALGMDRKLDLDYQSVSVEEGDVFLLTTDGVHEWMPSGFVLDALSHANDNLDEVARSIAHESLARGSTDNLTMQILRVESLPDPQANEVYLQVLELPPAPLLEAGMLFEGYRILREIRSSHRSHIFLALDQDSGEKVILKTPSIDQRGDSSYLERFLVEDWIARRIHSPHVVKPCAHLRKRQSIHVALEYVEGQTLSQWMLDHPRPDLATVRSLLEQVAKGLQAMHRLEMVHQDLNPDNIMVDIHGTVKLIDFGATRVPGLSELDTPIEQITLLGAAQYAAPEYFLGEAGSYLSDQFSLGVLAYQMLSGQLPYGAEVPKSRTLAAQRRLVYRSVLDDEREIPAWVDEAIRRAVHPDPGRRYNEVSEFIFDLNRPNAAYLRKSRPALIDKNPTAFWKGLSLVLSVTVLCLIWRLASH